MKKIDVLIVSTRKINFLKNCLDSIPIKNNIFIFVVINGFDEEKICYLEEYKCINNNIKYYVFKKNVNKNKARNLAISKTSSEIIYFIDDDVILFENTIDVILEKFKKYKNIVALGGPNLTSPKSTNFQKSVGIVLSSPLVCWKTYVRVNPLKNDKLCDEKSLILCNLAIRRDILEKEKLFFNEELNYAEENLLLNILKHKGYQFLYSPDLKVYHTRRNNIYDFCIQIFDSAVGRSKSFFIFNKYISPIFFIPTLFVSYLISTIFVQKNFYLILLKIYIVIYLLNSIYLALKNKMLNIIYIFILTLTTHISYGVGILYGLSTSVFKKHILLVKNLIYTSKWMN